MKRFRLYHPFWLSFTSRELYRDVAFNWKGFGLLYLALLVAFSVIVKLAVLQAGIASYLDEYGDRILKQVPTVTIEGGVATVEAQQPVIISLPNPADGADEPAVIIDTSGGEDLLEDSDAVVLISRTKIYAKNNQAETQEFNLSDFGDHTVGAEEVEAFFGFLSRYLSIAIFPVVMFFTFILTAFVMLSYGVIGMVFFRMWKAEPQFAVSMRLAVVAATPATLLDVAFALTGTSFQYWVLLKYIIMLIYLNVAVKWVFGERAHADAGPYRADV